MIQIKAEMLRRDFLIRSALLGAAGSATLRRAWARKKIPIGVQLYCVRRELAQNFDETMEAVAGIGFEGVEFADYFKRTAKQLRKCLDDNGLRCCGTHIYLSDMQGDKLKETVEFNQILGNQYLIVRWLDQKQLATPAAFAKTVAAFRQVAENLRPHGMRIGFHNHEHIFDRHQGKMLWNILADETPREVILQLDTGNASMREGVDVIQLLERNPGRTATIHIKPYSAKNPNAYVGEDELNWPRIIELCETTAGTEWYIIEYEREGIPPLKALKDNYVRFKKMLS